MNKQPHYFARLIPAIVLLCLLLYVVSYLALVTPVGREIRYGSGKVGTRFEFSHYRFDWRYTGIIYWPLEQMDRNLRRRAWEPDKPFMPPEADPFP